MFHAARITALAWSPDGKRLASGSLDGSVIVWDPWSSGAERITVKNAHPGGVTSLVWRDDARVCTGVSTRACGRGRCDDDETRGTIDRSIDRSIDR